MPTVLVVDDSTTMRKIVIKGVSDAGYGEIEFLEAGDGIQGLELLAKHDVDLILTDVNMPNMDGLQFVRCVRERKEFRSSTIGNKSVVKRVGSSIPIIMVTTEGGLDRVQAALTAGANDYLKKPFNPAQLQEKIAPFLG
jgi:two-component system chemotaxis response regulator CheY